MHLLSFRAPGLTVFKDRNTTLEELGTVTAVCKFLTYETPTYLSHVSSSSLSLLQLPGPSPEP